MDVKGKLLKVHGNYGTELIRLEGRGEHSEPLNGAPRTLRFVYGTVVEGHETSRLFQYSSTRDTAGEQRTLYGVKDADIERGEFWRHTCG